MKPTLLLAEDHPAMRAKVISLLQRDFAVVGSVVDGKAAVEAANKLTPDVVILDVSMPILNGTEVVRRLKIQSCKAKVVFLSLFPDTDQVSSCFAAGGDAYVSKMRMGTDLIYAITEVLAGRTFISPKGMA
jgi:DNA-binding NarL/FixJ family response regulator